MPYRKTNWIEQILYIVKYKFNSWAEWQEAKDWAKSIHPGWHQLATQRKRPEIRATYRRKILNAYRGYGDG